MFHVTRCYGWEPEITAKRSNGVAMAVAMSVAMADTTYQKRGPEMAENRFKFTPTRLEKLEPGKGLAMYYDTSTPLALWVTPGGAKTFCVYRRVNGRPIRVRIGRVEDMSLGDARKAATKLLGEVAGGADPAAERRARRDDPTLQALFAHWIAHAKRHKKTWRDDQRQWDKYLAKYGARKLSSITKADVAKWHATIGDKHGPVMANRVRALLSAMFGVADDIGFSGSNPVTKVKRFRESSRERFLQQDEMRKFFEAVRNQPPTWRDFPRSE